MKSVDERLREIESGRSVRWALGADITRNAFYLCVILVVAMGVWGAVSGFSGWRLTLLLLFAVLGIGLRVSQSLFERRLH